MGSSSSTSTHLRDSASDSESETTLNKSVIPEDIKSLMIYPESVSDADKKRYHKYFSDNHKRNIKYGIRASRCLGQRSIKF